MSDVRTVLITGATDGLGRALAGRLAREGQRVVLHGRDPQRLRDTAAQLRREHDLADEPATLLADFADLRQVRELAERVPDVVERLDVLVDNAGVGAGANDQRQLSADGHELRFAVNYLATFDLTQRLLPLLRAHGGARVVLVASLGQQALDFDDVMLERGYSGGRAYSQSKLAQITYGFALAPKLPAAEVTVNSLHPSTYMPTKMVLESIGHAVDTLEAGVEATRRLVLDPGLDGVTGRFYDRQRDARADPSAYDPQVQLRLWDLSRRLTGAPDV